MAEHLARELQTLASQKKEMLKQEQRLISELNAVLPSLGYRIVPNLIEVGDGTAAPPAGPRVQRRAVARLSTSVKKSLKCPHCDRRFALALHLGRHVSAMHRNGAGSTQKRSVAARRKAVRKTKAKAKTTRKPTVQGRRRPGRPRKTSKKAA